MSYFASCRPLRWQTVAWVSTCFTVQKDNSVIICGPDLEPHNTDLVLSSIKPTGENYQVPFLEVSCHYKREKQWSGVSDMKSSKSRNHFREFSYVKLHILDRETRPKNQINTFKSSSHYFATSLIFMLSENLFRTVIFYLQQRISLISSRLRLCNNCSCASVFKSAQTVTWAVCSRYGSVSLKLPWMARHE